MSETASGHGLKFSRWACRLTIRAMLMPPSLVREQLEFEHTHKPRKVVPVANSVPWSAPDWIYLHTLTFKDPEPSYAEGRRRWESFRKGVLDRGGWFGVCVPQWGEETRRLHFHLVTTRRPNAADWWQYVDAYGFGRYDVRCRPTWRLKPCVGMPSGKIHEAAWYVARYVARRDYWPEELRGGRSWSVFGSKHFPNPPCPVRDVRITTKVLTVVKESPRPFADFSVWMFAGDMGSKRIQLRSDASSGGHTLMREITPEQQKKINGLMGTGDIIGVGEYRVCSIETKDMFQYVGGQKSANKEKRVVVTHKVDFGAACIRREFDELLPVGADEKTVTPPAKSGDLVAVCIDSMTAYKGETSWKGRVFKL